MANFITANNANGFSLADGEQIVLVGNATVSSANGSGISGASGVNGTSMLILGSVLSNGSSSFFTYGGIVVMEGQNKVLIGSTGVVFGASSGLLLSSAKSDSDDGGNHVENRGLVSSAFGAGITAKLSNNYIANLGTVDGHTGIVAGSAGSINNTVVNSGSIFAADVAVTLYGKDSSLINSGTISTSGPVAALNLQAEAGQTITVLNTGTIKTVMTPLIAGIQGGAGNERITNAGTMVGDLSLGDGDDIYDGREGSLNGIVWLGPGNDVAYGGADNDRIFSGLGRDTVDGGEGNDYIYLDDDDVAFGGSGNDTFQQYYQSSLDLTLNGGDGSDTYVLESIKFSDATVDLRSTSPQKIGNGWGTVRLSGIENVKTLDGNDLLIGNNSNNNFFASAGSDTLEGGLGDDVLNGGIGFNFARFTGSTSAKVNLANLAPQVTGYGTDTFINIMGLIGGSGGDSFIGSGEANAFYGYAGKDSLSGGGGMDTLSGGLGNDKLTGGTEADVFVFNTKLNKISNVDTITDFRRVDDTIHLENAIFKKLTKTGPLNKNNLAFGAKAKDKNDYLVYDKAKGALYYDADGSGKGAAVKFAQLVKNTALDYKDFIII